jgi:hypothetical protein
MPDIQSTLPMAMLEMASQQLFDADSSTEFNIDEEATHQSGNSANSVRNRK